jgi:ankyrin repeat protein
MAAATHSAAGPQQQMQQPKVQSVEPDGTTPLHRAAQRNDLGTAERLVRTGANVNAANRYGVTPLSLACVNGNAPMIEMLLKAGADANSTLPEGETALMTAANTGNVAALRALLAHGANVNATESSKGQTALMWAVNKGHTAAAHALIEAGADINARSKGKFSPMIFAVRGGRIEIVRLLLAKGVKANDVIAGPAFSAGVQGATTDSTSLVGLAILNAQYHIAQLLLESGADPNPSDSRGSLLHTVAWMRRPGSPLAGSNRPDPVGDSLEFAKVLLAHGANPNVRIAWDEIAFDHDDGEVKSPPNIAAGRDFISMVGATPFFLAAKAGDTGLMRVLVANGADPRLPTAQGVTPFMAAAGIGYWNGETAGPFTGTPESERLEAVKLALDMSGEDVNGVADFGGKLQFDEDPNNLFFDYSLKYTLDPAVGRRPETALGDVRWAGSTALHGAVITYQLSIIRFLVEKGARLDARNQLGWTPLMLTQGMMNAANARFYPEAEALLKQLMVERGMDPAQYGRGGVLTTVVKRTP